MELLVGALASRLAIRNYQRTKRELGNRLRSRMDFLGQVRGGIAKAVQVGCSREAG